MTDPIAAPATPAAPAKLAAADFYVDSLPGLDQSAFDNFVIHAGSIPVDPAIHASLFFLMLDATYPQRPPHRKLLVWMNGGPGCSSMDGVFLENGPFMPHPNGSLTVKEHSWHHGATVVFLDQPLGTGYSTMDGGKEDQNMEAVTTHFMTFMENFFEIWPDLRKYDLYLAGESFAGVFIPYFATAITASNDDVKTARSKKFNLKGLLIGNGWMDPTRQYASYYDFAMSHSILKGRFVDQVRSAWEKCAVALHNNPHETIKQLQCETVLNGILDSSQAEPGQFCINMYDIRNHDTGPGQGCGLLAWPAGVQDMKTYLTRPEVRLALHAPVGDGKKWEECRGSVGSSLSTDSEPPYKLIPDLVSRTPILLFNGDKDLICNVLGIEWMVGNMTWGGAKGMGDDNPAKAWRINGTEVGTYRKRGNLTNVVIYEGSHMVPSDRPLESLDVFNRFIGVIDGVEVGLLSEVGGDVKGYGAVSPPKAGEKPPTPPSPPPPLISPSPPVEPPAKAEDDLGYDGPTGEDGADAGSSSGGIAVAFIGFFLLAGIAFFVYQLLRTRGFTLLDGLFKKKRGPTRRQAQGSGGSQWHELNTVEDEEIFRRESEEGVAGSSSSRLVR
ncbi:Cell death protease [Irineochytrium annulatum]|nr:Cell death protease [Irineochytrium annulatum]